MKMYLLRLATFALICFALSMPSWAHFVERRTVRLVYFVPNDRPFRAEVVRKMKDEIRNIQNYYAAQMQAHGYGRKTFRFETDLRGSPIVHRVNGKHPDKYYLNDTVLVWKEIRQRLETRDTINFIVVDNSTNKINPGGLKGRASIGGPFALVTSDFSWRGAAHELGHTFNLFHDFRDDTYLMSYGNIDEKQLSACAARFLAVSPTFNPQIRNRNTEWSTIKLISPQEYPTDAESVKIQVQVSDPEGLHQVWLMVKTKEPHRAAGGYEIKACRGLNGEKNAMVEFDYDGVIPSDGNMSLSDPLLHSISVWTVDTSSNMSFEDIVLISKALTLRPTRQRAILGNNQRGIVSTRLANPFVIKVIDQAGHGISGWPVTFAVTAGGGTLSVENTATDVNGHARTVLTLGPIPGVNTVEVAISGLEPLSFTAVGIEVPSRPLMEGSYQTWNLPAGAIGRFGKGYIRDVTFSPDGNTLAVGTGIGTWLYDASTLRELALLTGHTRGVGSVLFSPDGTKLVSAGGHIVKLWSIPTGENLATFIDDTNWVISVALSPDGSLIAAGSHESFNPGRITLWDVETRTNIATFLGDTNDFSALTFSPDGRRLASGSYNGEIKIWDVETGQNTVLAGHADTVLSVAFFPDGTKIVSAGGYDDNTIKLWDIATGNPILTMRTSAVNSIALSPDGTQIASAEGFKIGRIRLWDVATGNRIATLSGYTSGVGSVAFSSDSTKVVSGAKDKTIKVWDVLTHTAIATLEDPEFSEVVLLPDGTTLAANSRKNKDVKLWDVATGQNTATLKHTDVVVSLVFSSGGTTLALGTDKGTVKLWDVATGRNPTLTGHTGVVWSLAFSRDGTTLASGATDEKIKLWDVATGQNIATLGLTNRASALTFSRDGAILASGATDGKIKLWDVATGQNTTTLDGHRYTIESLAFSPDGIILASGERDIKLWDVKARQHIATFEDNSQMLSLAFSPDGTILAAGSERLRLWDIETGENIATLQERANFITYVSFSLDQTTLVSRSFDGTVLLWDMSPYLTSTMPPPYVSTLAEDINTDGIVNIQDLVLVASNFGKTGENVADVNGDGVVNIVDLTLVAGGLGNAAGAPSAWGRDLEFAPTRAQVEQWLHQARQVNLTDPAFQRGLLMLERLLEALTPKDTALLPNYPNPFNPETWIPYQLAASADVNISIYTADGRLVRMLDFGHRSVGVYESRSRAAYWDGRNMLGEPVASGVYFYTLTAGDFTATRKMLISK